MTGDEKEQIEHGKFYLAVFVQHAFIPPKWEPIEAYRENGEIYFKMTGTKNKLYTGEIIEIDIIPINTEKEMKHAKKNTNESLDL